MESRFIRYVSGLPITLRGGQEQRQPFYQRILKSLRRFNLITVLTVMSMKVSSSVLVPGFDVCW